MIETEQMDATGDVPGRPQNGEGIGGCPQPDVPNDEFASVVGQPFGQADLADVKGLGFGHRADDRMEGLAMGERMDAVNAAGKLDEFVGGAGCHGQNLSDLYSEAKLKPPCSGKYPAITALRSDPGLSR